MPVRSQMTKYLGLALVAAFAAQLAATDAMAAKEKFERSKPHVNIGTIGHDPNGESAGDTLQDAKPPAGDQGEAVKEIDTGGGVSGG